MLNQLVAMNEGKTDVDQSVYAKQAVKPERIKEVLKDTCCKKKCKGNLHWKLVLKMVTFFWLLPKVSQDGSESSGQPRHKVAWSIEGQE